MRPAIVAGIALLALAGPLGCANRAPSPAAPPPQAPVVKAPDPAITTYLLLKVGERRLYVMDHDPQTPIESFTIAVGRPGHETPIGRFEVLEMIEHPDFQVIDKKDRTKLLRTIPPGPANPLGERWIGFQRDDLGVTGIHGTPQPELLGKAVSGGCVRMRNADVLRVFARVKVGTPVIVEP
jgi:L,D-transpeptidase ErfK/SrfK